MAKRKTKIAVLMGGPSSEHEVSLKTGENVLSYLNSDKFEGIKVRIGKNGKWMLGNRIFEPKTILQKVDIVFNALHGKFGEDGHVQSICEFYGKPYTGSGVLASALAMNKAKSRQLFKAVGLSTPKSILLKKGGEHQTTVNFFVNKVASCPVVAKPNNGGSSVGVSIVNESSSLSNALEVAFVFDDEALLEEYIPGMEVTASVVEGYRNKEYYVLPPTHILPAEIYGFFSYDAKYLPGASREVTPAPLPKKLTDKIKETALKAHMVLGCRGYSRTDMILKGETVYVLELNTLPGMTETSLLPQQARAAGITFPKLLDILLARA